jgi:hypothetical protein
MPLAVAGARSFPTVVPGWDNTPRSGASGVVLHRATPELFKAQVAWAVAEVCRERPPEQGLIFVKSWNEWARATTSSPTAATVVRFSRHFKQESQKARRDLRNG